MEYTLRRGDLTATVQSVGAELVSFQKADKEYIWTGDSTYWNGHNPILFPVIGFLKDGKTCFDGQEYEIPKHGYARRSEFALLSSSTDSVTFEMTDTAETREGFPFSFALRVTHTLTDDGYVTAYQVRNLSPMEMPFMLGAHTGFLLPFSEGCRFEDHTLIFRHPEQEVTRYIAVNGKIIEDPLGEKNYLQGSDRLPLSYSLFDDDALMLAGLASRKVSLVDSNGQGVSMEFDGFDALGIWTPPGKEAPFLCIEPWNGINAFINEEREFSQKPFIKTVAAGDTYKVSHRVRIL